MPWPRTYRWWSWLLTVFGDLGICFREPRVCARHIRECLPLLQRGDVLGRTYDWSVDSRVIPGKYKHTMLYLGGSRVAHAVAEGVRTDDVMDALMHCDRFIAWRPRQPYNADAAARYAEGCLGKGYDFMLDPHDQSEFFCHELTEASLWAGGVAVKSTGSRPLADDIARYCDLIYETR